MAESIEKNEKLRTNLLADVSHERRKWQMLELDKVEKVYNNGQHSVAALQEINLKLPPQTFLAIQGKSGSGKSTILNILGCLDRPGSGTYFVDGEDTGTFQPSDCGAACRTEPGRQDGDHYHP